MNKAPASGTKVLLPVRGLLLDLSPNVANLLAITVLFLSDTNLLIHHMSYKLL